MAKACSAQSLSVRQPAKKAERVARFLCRYPQFAAPFHWDCTVLSMCFTPDSGTSLATDGAVLVLLEETNQAIGSYLGFAACHLLLQSFLQNRALAKLPPLASKRIPH